MYHLITHCTFWLSVGVVAGGVASHGTSGPDRSYPPSVSSPAPIAIVTPRLVEIVACPITCEFLYIMMAGEMDIIARLTTKASAEDFDTPVLRIRRIRQITPTRIKRGCINIARENQPAM